MYKSEVILMTPEIAKHYLENNFSRNRKLKKHKVEQYASDMLNGRWDENACDPIMISKSGKLLNGQHRLHAIIKANMTFIMEVRTGIPEKSYVNMDLGASRTVSEMLDLPQRANVSAAGKIEYCLKHSNGSLLSSLKGMIAGAGTGGNRKPPHADVIYYCEKNANHLLEAVRIGSRMKTACRSMTIMHGAGFVILLKFVGDDERLHDFVEDFCALNSNGSITIMTCKKKLNDIGAVAKKLPTDTATAILLYAYKNYKSGKPMKAIKNTDSVYKEYEEAMFERRKELK